MPSTVMNSIPTLVGFYLLVAVCFVTVGQSYGATDPKMITKLECKTGETRIFTYDSHTQMWGPAGQTVRMTGELRVHCMGPDPEANYGPEALKYMVEVLKLEPKVIRESGSELQRAQAIHQRTRRGIGDWFKGAWETVRNWVVGLFTNQARAKAGSDFDFDDSSPDSTYKCKDQPSEAVKVTTPGSESRPRRATDGPLPAPFVYQRMLRLPFEFIQTKDGSIPEIRFSDKEHDEAVKNFKKHIADTFATQLDTSKNNIVEMSPIGEHMTHYAFDRTGETGEKPIKTADGGFFKLIAMAFKSGSAAASTPQKVTIVRDIADSDVIRVGTDAASNPKHVDITAKQVQQIGDGRLMATAGHLFVKLVHSDDETPRRTKRSNDDETDANDDLVKYLKVKTQYSVTLVSRVSKRDVNQAETMQRLTDVESKMNFVGESLVATTSQKQSAMERLSSLRTQLGELFATRGSSASQYFDSTVDHMDPLFSVLLDVLDLESSLNEEDSPESMTGAVRQSVTREKLETLCGVRQSLDLNKCHALYTILIHAGSGQAIDLLTEAIDVRAKSSNYTEIMKQLAQVQKPTDDLINKLMAKHKESSARNDLKAQLLLTASSLAASPSVSQKTRDSVLDMLLKRLRQIDCKADDSALDTLEAVGNMGDRRFADAIVQMAGKCRRSDSHQFAAIHAARKIVAESVIQNYLAHLLKSNGTHCVVKQEVVQVLIDDINDYDLQPLKRLSAKWPKRDFNQIDATLADMSTKSADAACLRELVRRYFARKDDRRANLWLSSLKAGKSGRRRRRRGVVDEFWDESQCREWDNRPNVRSNVTADRETEVEIISDNVVRDARLRRPTSLRQTEVEETDSNSRFKIRRKCTAYKFVGPKAARASLRADVVNDVFGSDDNPEHRLTVQFALGTQFLGQDIDVGKMYIYHRRSKSRAYVNLFGRTLLDSTQDNCNPDLSQPYRYTHYVPLYDFNIWIVQITVGTRFTGEMSLNPVEIGCAATSRQNAKTNEVMLSPEASLRASAEASGKLVVLRSGMNVGGNFNYNADLNLQPDPNFCLTVFNGYNPMNVSVQTWYQFWDIGCSQWMDKSFWDPQSLNWRLAAKRKSLWIDNQCLLQKNI